MTSARQIYLGSRRGPALPYDAEVEYLETDGGQYIDLGVRGTNTTDIRLDAYRPSNSVAFNFFAQGAAWGRDMLCIVTGNGRGYWMYGASVSSTNITTNSAIMVGRMVFTSARNVLTSVIGGNTIVTTSAGTVPFTTPVNMYLFARAANTGGTFSIATSGSGVRVYGADISNNDVMLRSLIPVRFTNELGQSEGAMYDRVSGQLFRNSGTGAFNYGNDK